MTFTITLPLPPSANRYWRVPKALGRPILSAEARAYKLEAERLIKARGKFVALSCDVQVDIDWYRARRAGDLDNALKVTLDSLKGLVYLDDKQVARIVAHRYDDKNNPRVVVRVQPIASP